MYSIGSSPDPSKFGANTYLTLALIKDKNQATGEQSRNQQEARSQIGIRRV